MRGKPHVVAADLGNMRITPADAGKTGFFFFAFALLEDHPRGCGENCVSFFSKLFMFGITPADAGKTVVRWVCE